MEDLDFADSQMNRLAGETEQADPFCCRTEWQFSYHEAFSPLRKLYFRTTEDSLIAFAGYELPDVGSILEPIEAYWLFGSPLLGPHSAELLDALLHEEHYKGALPFILLSGLLPHTPLHNMIATLFEKQYEILRLNPSIVRNASLEGSLDGYLSRRSAKLRQNIRRATVRAADRGVLFERCQPASEKDAEAAYARMLAVEEQSWKGIGECGMTVEPSRDFYRRMLLRMSVSGMGRIIFARHEGHDIGFIYGGVAGGHYRGQQFSYAEEWSKSSLGSLLQMEKIRWLCEENVAWYDMGQYLEYKEHWAELEFRMDTLLLRPRR